MKKIAGWGFLLLLIAAICYVGYQYFLKSASATRAWNLVPASTAFILETREPIQAWNALQKTSSWNHLRTHPEFAEINKNCLFLDSLIQNNEHTLSFLGSRQVLISAHLTRIKDYDFLYIVDLQDISKIDFLGKFIKTLARQQGYRVTERTYQENDLIELYDPESRDMLTLCLYQNFLLVSYTPTLVEQSLQSASNPILAVDPDFLKIQQLTEAGIANLYIQFDRFDDYLRIYFQDDDQFTKELAAMLSFSGIQIDLGNQDVQLAGTILLNDSNQTYLHALRDVSPVEPLAHAILPDNTALYCSIGFDEWSTFWQALKKQYGQNNTTSSWQKNLDKLQNWLNYDIEKNFLSWIGQEVAIAVIPKPATTKPGYIMVLHTNQADNAKTGLDLLVRQVKRKTPLKFDLIDHKGHDIRYLEIKGFFKLLFGKLFARFDRPFYAQMGNFVLFSNDLETLKAVLDKYDAQKILQDQPNYRQFREQISAKSTVWAFWNMPFLYNTLPNFVSNESRASLDKNAPYIQAFQYGGIHWASQETHYTVEFGFHYQTEQPASPDTTQSEPDDRVLATTENDSLSEKKDGKHIEYYPNGKQKILANYKDGILDGKYIQYHENGKRAAAGYYQSGQKVGIWRYYDESGKMTEKKRYTDDFPDDETD